MFHFRFHFSIFLEGPTSQLKKRADTRILGLGSKNSMPLYRYGSDSTTQFTIKRQWNGNRYQ